MNSMVNRFYGRELMLQFCERNPLTRLKLDVAPSREIVYGVVEDRWELGFGPFQHSMPGHLETHGFLDEARTLVVHRNHPLYDSLMQKPTACLGQVPLLTSYLDDATKRPGVERLRNQFASVWEVSNLDLRTALCEAGMGVTYLSDRILDELEGFTSIEGAEFATIHRRVGLYYKKHKPLSEGAKRFVAICRDYFRAGKFQTGRT